MKRPDIGMILIETYWNVNSVAGDRSGKYMEILIETYWNVNQVSSKVLSVMQSHINRDILECKFHGTSCRKMAKYHINRDILECKWRLCITL